MSEIPWDQALCRQVGSDDFFPDKGGSVAEAKSVCANCPIIDACLEEALARDERFGVWGGRTERERRRIRRERGMTSAPVEVVAGTSYDPERCGTEKGNRAHYRRGETPCGPCRFAAGLAKAERKERRDRREAA